MHEVSAASRMGNDQFGGIGTNSYHVDSIGKCGNRESAQAVEREFKYLLTI